MMKKSLNVNLLIIVTSFIFYSFFALYDGVVWSIDSASYVEYFGAREPLYPFIIVIFRTIFDSKDYFYLKPLVLFQSLLLAYATCSFVLYIKKQFKTNNIYSLFILLVFLSVSLMCRFLAKRGSMYSNSILSESISYPLYILFIRYLLEYLLQNNNKSFIMCSLMSFLLISTRKQMFSSLLLLIISAVYVAIKNKTIIKGIVSLLISCLLILGTNYIFDYCFVKSITGIKSTHTSGNRFITTMILYTADRKDGELIDDQETKELFYSIYDACSANNYLRIESNSWYERVDHFHEHYDNIQIDTLMPMLREHAMKKATKDNVELLVDTYNNNIISALLMRELPKMISTIADSFLVGLMITISAYKQLFIVYAILMYVLYLILLIINIYKNGINMCSLFSLLVLASILINVGIISIVIFNQTRYTIYNTPLFYIALLLMLYNIFIEEKKEN